MKIRLDKLDILFSKYVRLRADNHCEFCGKYFEFGRLQCSHFKGRRRHSVRYDPDNAAALCFGCHSYLGENPDVHTAWFKKRLGSEKFEQLMARADLIVKPKRDEIEARLKEMIKSAE